jgi:hypothetical protein
MEIVQLRRHIVGLLLAATACSSGAVTAQVSGDPPWRTRLVPWETHAGQARPWRGDRRLTGYAAPGYPDDFQVLFANPDSSRGGQHELMWVRVIASDSATGLILGILLNQPHELRSVVQGDNVVFRVPASSEPPTAIGAPNYAEAGWPTSLSPFLTVLRDGIRAYRAGNNGHNMPGIERCISVLTPAMGAVPSDAGPEERFVGHFVLGRCMAEKYETERAIDQFRAAITLDPDDLDANMALLAELSVMTHRRPGDLSPVAEARWERDFLEQLGVIRARFAREEDVTGMLEMIFDPAQETGIDSSWKAHVAKLRRVGYAVFRWKRR